MDSHFYSTTCRQHAGRNPSRTASDHFFIMPHTFTFGIPKLFDFTFRAGHQSSNLTENTVAVESNSKNSADPDAPNQVKAIIPSSSDNSYPGANDGLQSLVASPSSGMRYSASSPCGTLSKLPLELRVMVYRSVLTLKKNSDIKNAHRLLDRHPPIMADECTFLESIDAALLRTCRAVYQEAVHILYGINRFLFRNPRDIQTFAHAGLGETPFGLYRGCGASASAVGNAPCGRLTMIWRMHLKVDSEFGDNDRKRIWSFWCDFFYPSKEQDQSLSFPALRWLALDFTDWELKNGDASKIRARNTFFALPEATCLDCSCSFTGAAENSISLTGNPHQLMPTGLPGYHNRRRL